MIEANGNIIMTDVQDIILELRHQLSLNGDNRFNKMIDTPANLMVCCPFHHNGQERKPSMGILKKSGVCHCFACGWVGSLSEMISNCFGYDDLGKFGDKWLVKNFLSVEVDKRDAIDLDLDRTNTAHNNPDDDSNVIVTDDELDSYRVYHPYMWKRKMNPEVVDIFDVGYDSKTDCLTFPVRDVHGKCLFVARRSVKTKYFHYPQGVDKPVYGVYELSQLEQFPDEIIIAESMINCITAWVYGKYAVALNGTGTKEQYEQLRKLPCRSYVLALDPDAAGEHGREKLRKALYDKLVYEYIIPEGKDLNDLTKQEFDNLKKVLN